MQAPDTNGAADMPAQAPAPSASSGHWTLLGRQAGWVQLVHPGGQTVLLPAMRPPGFLDAANYPVSPRADAAYVALNQQLDALANLATAAKRRKLQEQGSSSVMLPPSTSIAQQHTAATAAAVGGNGAHAAHAAAGASQQAAGIAGASHGVGSARPHGDGPSGGEGSGHPTPGKASRFKPLSVEVPTHGPLGGGGNLLRHPGVALPGPGGMQQEAHEREAGLMTTMGSESLLPLPSPSTFLASGPHSLGTGMSFSCDLGVATQAGHPRGLGSTGGTGAPDSLPGSAVGLAPSDGPGSLMPGDMPGDMATPTTATLAAMNNNDMAWSPVPSMRMPGDSQDGADDGLPAGDISDLMVLGRGMSASRLAAEGKSGGVGPAAPHPLGTAAAGDGVGRAADVADGAAQGGAGGTGAAATSATGTPSSMAQSGARGGPAYLDGASAIDIPIDIV